MTDSKGKILAGAAPKRLTKWDKNLCERLVTWRAHGWSISQVCSKLGISEKTYYQWKQEHPEWQEAADYGDTVFKASLEFAEDEYIADPDAKVDRKMFSDKRDRHLGGKGGNGAINIDTVNIANIDDASLTRKIESLSKRLKMLQGGEELDTGEDLL